MKQFFIILNSVSLFFCLKFGNQVDGLLLSKRAVIKTDDESKPRFFWGKVPKESDYVSETAAGLERVDQRHAFENNIAHSVQFSPYDDHFLHEEGFYYYASDKEYCAFSESDTNVKKGETSSPREVAVAEVYRRFVKLLIDKLAAYRTRQQSIPHRNTRSSFLSIGLKNCGLSGKTAQIDKHELMRLIKAMVMSNGTSMVMSNGDFGIYSLGTSMFSFSMEERHHVRKLDKIMDEGELITQFQKLGAMIESGNENIANGTWTINKYVAQETLPSKMSFLKWDATYRLIKRTIKQQCLKRDVQFFVPVDRDFRFWLSDDKRRRHDPKKDFIYGLMEKAIILTTQIYNGAHRGNEKRVRFIKYNPFF